MMINIDDQLTDVEEPLVEMIPLYYGSRACGSAQDTDLSVFCFPSHLTHESQVCFSIMNKAEAEFAAAADAAAQQAAIEARRRTFESVMQGLEDAGALSSGVCVHARGGWEGGRVLSARSLLLCMPKEPYKRACTRRV